MSARNEVLLMTRDPETERAVDLALESTPQAYRQLAVCADVRELMQRMENRQTAVALIDTEPHPMAILSSVEPLIRKFPATRFVVLCRESGQDLVLESMQIGARYCLPKGSIVADLPGALKRLLQDAGPTSGAGGKIITVLSASGGCGGTTLSINLAEELHQHSGKPSLIIDMDRFYGAVGTYLGLKSSYGIVDVLAQRGTIDAQLVGTTAMAFDADLHVLLSPASIDFADPLPMPYDQLDAALLGCRQAFDYTVIDAPRMPMDVAATLAQASALTFIVLELAVIDIRTARAMLNALTDLRVPHDKIHFIANRFRKRNPMLSLEDAQKALERSTIHTVSNDFESAIKSINYGQTLADVAPRSAMRKDIRDLVAVIESQSNHSPR